MDRFTEADMFVQTVDAGSITAAAERLSVDKSIVSRRLKALENRLGIRLLNRSTRRLSLTEAGRGYYQRAEDLLQSWREMEDEASGAERALAGSIRLAAPLSFGLSQLGPTLIDFQKSNPDIRLDLDLSDRKIDLIAEGFDLAVRIGRLDDSSLIARKLGDVEMVCAVAPSWLKANGPIETIEDLRDAPELRYGLKAGKSWAYQHRDGARGTIQLDTIMRATNGDFLRDAAIAGLGLVIEPDFIVCDAIRAGDLAPVLPDYHFDSPSVYAVWPPRRHLSRRVRALVDHLKACFGDVPPWSIR